MCEGVIVGVTTDELLELATPVAAQKSINVPWH
jgi:hypothetical protein